MGKIRFAHGGVRTVCLLLAFNVVLLERSFAQTPAPIDVTATGPTVGEILEDRVEIQWSTSATVGATHLFAVYRDSGSGEELLTAVGPQTRLYEDRTAAPNVEYEYCVRLLNADEDVLAEGCDDGMRLIGRPTGFDASDGLFGGMVFLSWSDRSEIEAGFNLYRDGGNALQFDGTNDYALADAELELTGSFTFEFWAKRNTTGGPGFIVNLETSATGSPVDADLEIGFNDGDFFQMGFGTNVLAASTPTNDTNWHHWAVVYDDTSRRRFLYRDGQAVGSNQVSAAFTATGELEFGRRARNGNTRTRGHFNGALDEVRLWTRALTQAEIETVKGSLLTGSEPGLAHHWPMDVSSGTHMPDLIGGLPATLIDMSAATAWIDSGIPDYRLTIGSDLTTYADRSATPGFQTYTFQVAAYEDMNGNGRFEPGTDFESERRTDTGWRGEITPPVQVSATDGQYLDKVRITWIDQSDSETGYAIYRDNVLIGSVPADSVSFFDEDGPTSHTYCVAALADGAESVRVCDTGRAGGLTRPENLTASYDALDDRVALSWSDIADTESGFEILRDDVAIAEVPANVATFNDFSADQGIEYSYCVRAFSDADPLNRSASDTTCAPGPGRRAVVLPPTDVAATDSDFEDRIDLSWSNPSKTALLFKVYEAGTLIEILDFSQHATTASGMASDSEITYCVSALTVYDAAANTALQNEVAQVLTAISHDDAVSLATGGAATSPAEKLRAVEESLTSNGYSKTGSGASGFYESSQVCDTGSRSLAAPTDVAATDNASEDFVEVSWTNNSQVLTGFHVFRAVGAGTPTLVATVTAGRTSFKDFEGTPGVQYSYSVEAFDPDGISARGSDLGQRTLEPPTGLEASDRASETEIVVEWNDNSAAEDGYRVYRRPAGTTSWAAIGTTAESEPRYVDAVPIASLGVGLEYKVTAFDAQGESVGATDDGSTALNAPVNVNASSQYSASVVVVWVDRSNVEAGYRITRRPVLSQSTDVDVTIAAGSTRYDDTTALASTEYEYCVYAYLGSGASTVYSDPACSTGEVYVPGGGGGGTQVLAKRIASPGGNYLRFGTSVAIDADTVLVGIPGYGTDGDGAVRRYKLGTDNTWTLQETWEPGALPIDEGAFGSAVALDGDYAAVGDPDGTTDAVGNFVAYTRDAAGTWTASVTWNEDSDASGFNSNVGFSVALADTFAIIGDNEFDNNHPNLNGGATICKIAPGAACDRGAGVPKLDELDGVLEIENGAFGQSVGIARGSSRLYAIVGAPGGDLAYIFDCNASTENCALQANWRMVQRLSAFSAGSRFGEAVAITPSFALVGAPGAERVQVYERVGDSWEPQDVLAPDATSVDFGAAVAIRDNNALIGAPGERISGADDAGAVYAFEWDAVAGTWSESVRYDARVDGAPAAGDRFGASVAVGPGFYVVGAPENDTGGTNTGAAYSIPFAFEPSDPVLDEIATPSRVRVSDGRPEDRIRVQWDDESDGEDGHYIYRSDEDGVIEQIADVAPNVELYEDFEATAGDAYTYCVAAYVENATTGMVCDRGWRPPNGTISGLVASREGGGTEDATVCIAPNPNRSLLFDGFGGHVEVTDDDALDLTSGFTIEAWIKPNAVDGIRRLVSKAGAFGFGINAGNLRFTTYGVKDYDLTLGTALTSGSWYHVAVVMDGSFGATFFVNGSAAGSTVSGTTAASTSDSPLLIGQAGSQSEVFKGEIDELRLWNVARTATEISDGRFQKLTGEEEGLVGYWPLDQGRRLVAPDITTSANHGLLRDGVYVTDEGAPLTVCATTDVEGNYGFSGIRYGESTEFTVTPSLTGRRFAPAFKKITLTAESPVQNEVRFTDVTAFTLAGKVLYRDILNPGPSADTLLCPVPDVSIHVDKGDIPTNDNVKTSTAADGSYAVSVLPSLDANDRWFVMPTYVNGNDASVVHTFSPTPPGLVVDGSRLDLDYFDQRRHTLTGSFSGGDPVLCGKDIGTATIRVYTEDGCYDRTITVNSASNGGAFSMDLPPLEYLMEVTSIVGAPDEREDDIKAFFENLGTIEVDLTAGDVHRNLTYRAPIVLTIAGLNPPTCAVNAGQIVQLDEEDAPLRTLPAVPVIKEYQTAGLTIQVREDYGNNQFCNVNDGTVTIYDAIADRVDVDSSMVIAAGQVDYTTIGASPNVFAGARVQGVDRSFQKPLTVIAFVEGREPITETLWAIVLGSRERQATFVSATTEEMPFLILRDPPGSNSFAFIEEGSTLCHRISKTTLTGGAAGPDIDVVIGFKARTGTAGFGVHFTTDDFGGGVLLQTRTVAGREDGELDDAEDDELANIEICATTTETYATSNDPTWVGEDIFVGAALNLIFALADQLDFQSDATCALTTSEVLAMDLNEIDPFETTYAFGKSHIALSLIPELENLIRIAGDQNLGSEPTLTIQEAVDNWEDHLDLNESLKEAALKADSQNRSFSAGAEFSYVESADTTRTTYYDFSRIYVESENATGAVLTAFYDQKIAATFEVHSEWVTEEDSTESTSQAVGYVLSDGDTGDYFSVDVARDPTYSTFVFETKSGRSSNPWEANTQRRDNPIIEVNPPVLYNVDPDGAGMFELTLINGSESNERRPYIMAIPGETNRQNLVVTVTGDILGGARLETWLLDPMEAITVNMDVYPSPSSYSYRDVGVVLYPENEFEIWKADPRQPFAMADTAFFSVFFDSTGGSAQVAMMQEGWSWFSLNRGGGVLAEVLGDVPATQGDVVRGLEASSRYDSTAGWVGDLARLEPGEGYRIRLRNKYLFRSEGDAVDPSAPIPLEKGWNWVGYLPTGRMSIDRALASLAPTVRNGDAVVGQGAFAQYVSGKGWVGPLDQFEPGDGYALYVAEPGELVYPAEADSTARPRFTVRSSTAGPEWRVEPERYESSMTLVADVRRDDIPLTETPTRVGVFAGDELRGMAEVTYVETMKRYLAFVMVHGGFEEESDLEIKVFDPGADSVVTKVATLAFKAGAMLGSPSEPLVLDLAHAGGRVAEEIPERFALNQNYPNPFNPSTTISFDVPQPIDVQLIVYDMLGRKVATLVNGERVAGSHKVVFDARSLASGMYVYRIEAGDFVEVRKMVLVK